MAVWSIKKVTFIISLVDAKVAKIKNICPYVTKFCTNS